MVRAPLAMIVKVEQIRNEGGLRLKEPVDKSLVQAALDDVPGGGLRAEKGFDFSAHLQKVGTGVLLKGEFTAEVVVPCKRCLRDVRLTVPASFTLNLVPENLAANLGVDEEGEDDGRTERAGSFRLDDAEQDTFDGKVIEIDPILREQLLLALPMSVVCDDACKGLCAQCGQNLNETVCECAPPLDPRLAGLKDIKLN